MRHRSPFFFFSSPPPQGKYELAPSANADSFPLSGHPPAGRWETSALLAHVRSSPLVPFISCPSLFLPSPAVRWQWWCCPGGGWSIARRYSNGSFVRRRLVDSTRPRLSGVGGSLGGDPCLPASSPPANQRPRLRLNREWIGRQRRRPIFPHFGERSLPPYPRISGWNRTRW